MTPRSTLCITRGSGDSKSCKAWGKISNFMRCGTDKAWFLQLWGFCLELPMAVKCDYWPELFLQPCSDLRCLMRAKLMNKKPFLLSALSYSFFFFSIFIFFNLSLLS